MKRKEPISQGSKSLIAIVRAPPGSMGTATGLHTRVARTPIDFARAQEQHVNYACALQNAGAHIVVLPEANHLPQSAFVGDAALVLDSVAVLAQFGTQSRRQETPVVAAALSKYRYLISLPEGACFDAGDALVIERSVYVAQSQRTNAAAIDFLRTFLRQHSYEVAQVPVSGCLRLKSAVSYLGNNSVLINREWIPRDAFAKHVQILVDFDEPTAANALLIGNQLLMSASFPATFRQVEMRGFRPRTIDIGEFHKAEGGLTCLSILVNTPDAL